MRYLRIVLGLWLLLAASPAVGQIKLIGPKEAKVAVPFEVSVEGLALPLSTFETAPPQITWLVLGGECQVKQRLELVLGMVDGKPVWSAAPYVVVTPTKAAEAVYVILTVDRAGGFAQQASLGVALGPPPDPPPGKRWVLLIEESSERTPELAALRTAIERNPPFKTPGQFRMIDKDLAPGAYAQWVARAKSLPYLFVVDSLGGVAFEGPCPVDVATFTEVVKKAGG
jgi:hypothetical protein